jgi:hypothetical protein
MARALRSAFGANNTPICEVTQTRERGRPQFGVKLTEQPPGFSPLRCFSTSELPFRGKSRLPAPWG